jgi:hypothetical protein
VKRNHPAYKLSNAHFWAAAFEAERALLSIYLTDLEDGEEWFETWMNGGEL